MIDSLLKPLDVLPRFAYPFLWADYVELLCLCSKNSLISKGNLQAQAQEAEDLQADLEDNRDENSEPLDDKISNRWGDIQKRLQARSKSFPGWPFELDGDVLRSRFEPEKPDHRLYVTLLVASSLRLCLNKRHPEITGAFEEISYHWLRQSLTSIWQVRLFGAHQTLPNSYSGTLYVKLSKLAQDVQGRLLKSAQDYDPRDTGDGGIDLVAWQNMGDQRGNMLVIFGQCACSPTDWESKQLDVTPASTEAHIHLDHPGAAYCFVPHDLSINETTWARASHVRRTIIVDRLRLLNLFEVLNIWHELPKWPFTLEVLQSKITPAT